MNRVLFTFSIFAGMTVLRVFSLFPPIVVGKIIDNLKNNNFHEAKMLIVGLFIIFTFKFIIDPLFHILSTMLIQDIIKQKSIVWTGNILDKSHLFFKKMKLGSILRSTDRGIIAYETFLSFAIGQIFPNIIEVFFVLIYLTYLVTPHVGIILCSSGLLLIYITLKGVRMRRPFIDAVNNAEDEVSHRLSLVLNGGRSIRAAGAKKKALDYLGESFSGYADSAVKLALRSGILSSSQAFTSSLAVVTILSYGVFLMMENGERLTIGDFVVLFSFSNMFLLNIQKMAEAYKNYDHYRADKKELDRVLDLPNFRQGTVGSVPDKDNLEIHPFRLTDGETNLLVLDFEITIPFGSKVAILGETGGGKTTFAEVLSGMREIKNAVSVGGCDCQNISEDELSKIFYFDFQEQRFLSGPFYQTVLYNLFTEHKDKITEMMTKLLLHKFVLEIECDNFAVSNLSGGELKRLSLLRALLSQKKITILDEPTSSLDEDTALAVWNLLFSVHPETLTC
ncbi:ABC transporter ATP-binding protein [uncultured Desulfuromonas sp.]|uniref:ABC transporter ATP-binding protein n=1 Tax=uncultured Desulfuromonas sp. TaxID=181013 RepID=UPI002AAA9DAD|nr:ABC transporter ATP-binding protein [uncultured Desulfuromonas sp.]